MSYQLNSVIAADVRTAPPIGTPTLLRGGSLPERDYEQRSALCIGNLHAPVNADSTTGGNALGHQLTSADYRLSASGPEIRQAGAIRIADQFTTIPYIEEVYRHECRPLPTAECYAVVQSSCLIDIQELARH